MANKAVFTNEITDYIIDSVRAAEYVWNHASPLYKLKSMKGDFWIRLTKEINIKFNPSVPVSHGDVSRKWNNLKSYYNYECQRVMKAKQCEYVPSMVEVDWKNKSKMDFLGRPASGTNCKRINDFYAKPKISEDELFNQSNFESQDESWSGDTGTQSSFQVPELSIEMEEEKFSDILKKAEMQKAECTTKSDDDQLSRSLPDAHSSTQQPISTSDEDDQTSSINTYKRPRESTERLTSMVANLIEQQNTLFARPPTTLEYPEMYAFWDSIIKEIPAEALPEIKFEVTAVLHTIYKKYKK